MIKIISHDSIVGLVNYAFYKKLLDGVSASPFLQYSHWSKHYWKICIQVTHLLGFLLLFKYIKAQILTYQFWKFHEKYAGQNALFNFDGVRHRFSFHSCHFIECFFQLYGISHDILSVYFCSYLSSERR